LEGSLFGIISDGGGDSNTHWWVVIAEVVGGLDRYWAGLGSILDHCFEGMVEEGAIVYED